MSRTSQGLTLNGLTSTGLPFDGRPWRVDAPAVTGLPHGYELVRTLGAGGFGEVVLARQVSLDRLVAVKRIHAHALADRNALERFRREGTVLAGLAHPAIVRVYDFRRDGADALLVMEYVEGSSLADLLDLGAVPVEAALTVLDDVADALAEAAAHGIAHRDVKPANVFVLRSGRAKLGDFGLARVAADPAVFRTSDGSSIGTPAYFPPETGQGLSEPDARSDAYSFAVMAYEVLTGRLPYDGVGAIAMIAAHWSQEPPAPVDVVPGFPPAASEALLAGLSKDPAQRPLPCALMAALHAVPTADWPATPAATSPAPSSPPAGRAPPTVIVAAPPPPPLALVPARRRNVPIAVAGLALLALVGALVGFGAWYAARDSTPLRIDDVRLTVVPAVGACPSASYQVTATFQTNGAGGDVRLQWTQPGGTVLPATVLAVPRGRRDAAAVLSFTVTGERPLRGPAVLRVLSPDPSEVSSPAISYTC